MITQTLETLIHHQNLSFTQTQALHDQLLTGQLPDAQVASYLTAMAAKGANAEEIAGAAASMQAHALPFVAAKPVLDVVGTGGDHANSFNISTTSMFVVAAAGVPVAKHGNQAASSRSGAADVLSALGYRLDLDASTSEAMLNRLGVTFLFAQHYHPAMRYVASIRKQLGVATIFNLIGPLANPARPTYQLLGVADASLMPVMAEALHRLGVKRAMVVHGQDGLDEVTPTTLTDALLLDRGNITSMQIDPAAYGIRQTEKAALTGGTPAENAAITRTVLSGIEGPKKDAVVLNAAVAMFVAERVASIADGVHLANQILSDGSALRLLDQVVAASQAVSA